MTTILLQWVGVIVFAIATRALGRRLGQPSTADDAQRTSRIGHALYWTCLAFPLVLGLLSPGLSDFDALVGFPPLPFHQASLAFGIMLLVAGIMLIVASSMRLAALGRGTAAFKLTSIIVRSGIYSRMRNPMSLGFYLAAIGLGFAGGSMYWLVYAAVGLIPAHLFYLVYFEERELALRFGDDYERYRRSTPLLIPSLGTYSPK